MSHLLGRIAYVVDSPPGWSEINVDGSDGGGLHVVIPSGGGWQSDDFLRSVAFRRDGTQAVFDTWSTGRLWISAADGTGARRLTTPPVDQLAVDRHPVFSPDGAKVYFTRYSSGTGNAYPLATLMAVPSAGGAATPVPATTDPNGDLTPAVSPDGTKLAYVVASPIKQAPAGDAVAVIDLATGRRLATIPSAASPQFSPNGGALAVISYAAGGNGAVRTYAPDGTGLGEDTAAGDGGGVASGGGEFATDVDGAGHFTFSPDGARIVFPSTFGLHASSNGTGLRIRDLSTGHETAVAGVGNQTLGFLDSAAAWIPGAPYIGAVTRTLTFSSATATP